MRVYSTLTTKYQVTIPKEVRKHFSYLNPITKVVVSKYRDKIVIEEKKTIGDFIG